MTNMTAERGVDPWRRRLYLPAYKISDAARYSQVQPQVVTNWHHRSIATGAPTLPGRHPRQHLSYLELVEVALVSVFRRLGVSLEAIARTREYMRQTFGTEYPFTEYDFKTDGMRMLFTWREFEDIPELNEVIVADAGGQLGWELLMVKRLAEFDYEHELALMWHVAGRDSRVLIDPRQSFGAPTVHGVPTWVLNGRWEAGASIPDIVDDFGLEEADITDGLAFEGVALAA